MNMAVQEYKERVLRVIDGLSERKAAQLAEYAEQLCAVDEPGQGGDSRELGFYEGRMRILPGFFDPLPEEIQAAFEGRGK